MSPDLDRPLGHAQDNDGIDEFDNPLPGWWVGLLWVTIAFAAVYAVEYHFVSHRSQASEYEHELATLPLAFAGVAAGVTPERVAAGKAIYHANCVGCHGTELKGGIGPDLTDAIWIHGGSIEQVTHTIDVGVPERGMLTWGPILGPEKVAQVAAFVHEAGGGQ